MPALDGLRAAAVAAVLLYHADVAWARGGYLGVDAFFVLSGFLITSLLLVEWQTTGGIALPHFWRRRARRLLPALFLVLGAVAVFAANWAPADVLERLRGDAFAAIGYVANWRFIASGQSYFAQFASPSPLQHVWSLAIEEQFYLVWPPAFLLLLRLTRGSRAALVGVTVALAATSALLMAALFTPGNDPGRVYFGTDTRAQSLLIGATLALLLERRRVGTTRIGRRLLHATAMGAALLLLWAWARTPDDATWLYRGGLAVTALLVAVVIASVIAETPGPLGRVLSLRPVRWIGLISYGLYLWHWPVYIALSSRRTGLDGPALLAVRLACTVAIATASYYLVELPIRRGGLRGWRVRVLTPATALVVAVAFVVATTSIPRTGLAPEAANAKAGAAPALAPQGSTPPPAPGVVRGVLIGDSVAFTLGVGFDQVQPPTLELKNAGVLGCGVIRGDADIGGTWHPNADKCDHWSDTWPEIVSGEQAQVVVAFWGAWDMFDRRVNGQVMRWGTPELDQYLTGELDHALGVLASTGVRVMLLTAPYYEPPDIASRVDRYQSLFEKPRVDHWNELLRSVAQAHQDSVSVIDLHAFLDPNGDAINSIAGVDDLRSDGIHFTAQGADVVARWLSPRIVRIAHRTRQVVATTNASARSRSRGP
jgi:peptidoglycan/LPS O-acetylase OafA/YrhL/lysophospholipase L1-like esterase